ncbi:unnamed protein product [Mytilus coruscus]|uniref:Uncharacterized protein n=1 Tax=Mytilus coruscus TaxID=42192 RepID=A0A6J8C2A6_MYTCO|nr:unnamed protein product [Mytilus coruscus]
MSKSSVHIRMSDKDIFLHEHEIFEMMKSRTLYQMQFDLRRKLEKRIRSIELAEKVHMSTFQSKKTLFLNKMREKIRQKNFKRFSTEIMRDSVEAETEAEADIHFLSEDENDDDDLFNNEDTNKEKVRKNIRSKSLVSVITSENEKLSERPITSRSVVSLNGKSLAVAKSSGRQRIDQSVESNKALVTEITIYPGDFTEELATVNTLSHTSGINDKIKTNRIEEKHKKNTKFNLKENELEKRLSLPTIPNAEVVKNLASFEMGTLTPDGHLLLTKDDYKNYMDKFERKREKRLCRVRRQSESLDQKVRDFTIDEE